MKEKKQKGIGDRQQAMEEHQVLPLAVVIQQLKSISTYCKSRELL